LEIKKHFRNQKDKTKIKIVTIITVTLVIFLEHRKRQHFRKFCAFADFACLEITCDPRFTKIKGPIKRAERVLSFSSSPQNSPKQVLVDARTPFETIFPDNERNAWKTEMIENYNYKTFQVFLYQILYHDLIV